MSGETRSDIQVENGEYVRIHNQIMEKLAIARLNGSEFRCVLFLLRKTYGWNKKEEQISLSQWEEGTDVGRTRVFGTVSQLVRKNIIYRVETGPGLAPIYGFNKYFDQWDIPGKDSNRSRNFHKNNSVSEIENGTIPEIGDTTIPELENSSVLKIGNTSVSEIENGTIPEIEKHKIHIKDTVKNKVKDTFPETKKRVSEPKNPERNLIFSALAKICKVDMNVKRGQLNSATKTLIDSGYTSTDILDFELWWYQNDWRGARGQPPTISQVGELVLQSKQPVQADGDCRYQQPKSNGVLEMDFVEIVTGGDNHNGR